MESGFDREILSLRDGKRVCRSFLSCTFVGGRREGDLENENDAEKHRTRAEMSTDEMRRSARRGHGLAPVRYSLLEKLAAADCKSETGDTTSEFELRVGHKSAAGAGTTRGSIFSGLQLHDRTPYP